MQKINPNFNKHWELFQKTLQKSFPSMPEEVFPMLRVTFYTGAFITFQEMAHRAANPRLSYDEAVRFLGALEDELTQEMRKLGDPKPKEG